MDRERQHQSDENGPAGNRPDHSPGDLVIRDLNGEVVEIIKLPIDGAAMNLSRPA
jgi:hypothetical protein